MSSLIVCRCAWGERVVVRCHGAAMYARALKDAQSGSREVILCTEESLYLRVVDEEAREALVITRRVASWKLLCYHAAPDRG